jgi:hypothetical protein
LKNAHKLSFLSQFFVIKQDSTKNNLHTCMGLFKKAIYVRGTTLTKEGTQGTKITTIVLGDCSYSKVVKTSHDKGKEVGLFSRGPKSIVGAEFLAKR